MASPFAGEVHPAAELFPLMGDDELAALAADIKSNGLRQPLILDSAGRLIDGRNRLRACEAAGVEPQFVSVNGDDPVALVVSLNVRRRNLSASQRAVAAAEASRFSTRFGNAERKRLAGAFATNETYLANARALVERDPDAAAAVKAGAKTLDDAYRQLRQREADLDAATRKAEVLRDKRPDLAERVETSSLTLNEAYDLMAADDARERQQRETMVQNIRQALLVLTRPAEMAAGLIDELEANDHDYDWTPAECATASAFLAALEARLTERKKGSR